MSTPNAVIDESVDKIVKAAPRRRPWVLGSILVALLIGSRFFALDADPPHSMSKDYVSDEGWWAHNARQHVVFGRWIMDEHNAGLMWAPLYSGALRVIYQVAGCGLWQTRSLAAISGVATCLAVFVCLRSLHGMRAAMFSSLLLATNYFWLSYNRVAFVESFQAAMVTGSMLAVAASVRRPVIGMAAGLLFGLAVLAKISALSYSVVFAAFWAWQWISPGQVPDKGKARWCTLRAASGFAGGVAAVLVIAWLLLVLPNGTIIAAEGKKAVSLTAHQRLFVGIATLGIGQRPQGLFTSHFILHAPLLLAGVVCIAVRQLADWRRPLDSTTRLCWCWLILGLVMIGVRSHFDEDRRYLAMLPAMSILLGIELAQSGLTIVSRRELIGRSKLWLRILLAGVVAMVLGFALRTQLTIQLFELLGPAASDPPHDFGQPSASALAWLLVSFVAFCLLVPLARWLPADRMHLSAGVVLLVIVGLNVAKVGYSFSHRTYMLPQAAQVLTQIGQRLPEDSPVVLGDSADTLGLGTRFFTFIIRRWDHNQNYLNLDGWERFDPSIVLSDEVKPGYVHVTDLGVAPDRQGKPQVLIPVWVRESSAESLEQVPIDR
jgi:4-amino-4-deoxy-L-arabinose transferase-like glycosyltransferase